MAVYKYSQHLKTSTDPAFDREYTPLEVPRHSGIYRCGGCGLEIVMLHEIANTLQEVIGLCAQLRVGGQLTLAHNLSGPRTFGWLRVGIRSDGQKTT